MENATKDMKKINVTNEIIRRLKSIGFTGTISQLIKYYISENIKYLFGSEEIAECDIELLTSNNRIELKSIYSKQTYYIVAGHEREFGTDFIRCERKVNEDDQPYTEFEIVETGSNCRSTLALSQTSQEESLNVKTLDYRAKDNKFTLIYWSIGSKNNTITHYEASLTPIYAKVKDKDWFSYNLEYPIIDKEESFLKRIYNEVSGTGQSRMITTDYDVRDFADFALPIYQHLEDDAKRVLKKSFEDKEPEQGEKKRIHNN